MENQRSKEPESVEAHAERLFEENKGKLLYAERKALERGDPKPAAKGLRRRMFWAVLGAVLYTLLHAVPNPELPAYVTWTVLGLALLATADYVREYRKARRALGAIAEQQRPEGEDSARTEPH